MDQKKRNFVGLLAAMPLMAFADKANAFSTVSPTEAGLVPISLPPAGLWSTLAHATDGTDPSTSITTELPRFTPQIKALAGKRITLEGFAQSTASQFGKVEYVLSHAPFHCPYCYASGRGSLALIKSSQPLHIAGSEKPVKINGKLVLQDKVPDDFYYILEDAKLI